MIHLKISFLEVFPPEKIPSFVKTLGIQIYTVMDTLESFVAGWAQGPQRQAGSDPTYIFQIGINLTKNS